MSPLKKLASAACATLILFSTSACSATAGKAEKKGEPVVKVNGVAITKPEVDRALKVLLAQSGVTQQLPPEQMKKALDQVLIQLTSAELLYQEASQSAPKDLDKLVEEKYAQNRAKYPSDAEYDKALQSMNMTTQEVKDAMRHEIVVTGYIEKEVAPKVAVTDAEVKKFYDDNQDKYFKKGERIKASHILVGVDQKAAPQLKRQAKEKAETLLKRVKGGEDFAEVAKKESTCPSAARGGDLGVIGKGQVSTLFDKAAFAMKKGEMSGVVESEMGYHIIKVNDRIAPGTEKFEEVKEKIAQYLKQDHLRRAVAECVDRMRSKSKIEKL
ncbi:peptidylprolyl isomerase [Geomonas sp. Red69]|uniref:peptidylprolyl isomerase n=1 Tax=Geomonas diazotrophica TaxID=2843197 RepID=UPI001C11520B|nr:peptidylprolyl isomerase [Geomonas diazotrophica]MBU5638928.1 peptidylprolyl isomerase [Geomonas diazotrophica]